MYNSSSIFNAHFEEQLKKTGSAMVTDSFIKAESVYRKPYSNICVSVSGGSDSDIIVDICTRLDPKSERTRYLWVNTGLEYEATKRQLDYLEKRYGIEIIREKAAMSIPNAVRQYGQPFLSKKASEYMMRLQRHGFEWEDADYDTLIQKYPNCQSALHWWCNDHSSNHLNICNNKYLKEYIIRNPPKFQISNLCCKKAKKDTLAMAHKKIGAGLEIVGIRKAEGGVRATRKGCVICPMSGPDNYAPIFWYKADDKASYEKTFDIKHSDCYTEYGLPRTGCAGCPCGRNYKEELSICDRYEPKLARAARNIFADSYSYTEGYKRFRESL